MDKVLNALSNLCISNDAKTQAAALRLHQHPDYIKPLLDEAEEFKTALDQGESIDLSYYESIGEELGYMKVENFVLSVEAVMKIYAILVNIQNITSYFTEARRELYPVLYSINKDIPSQKELIKFINNIIDEEGNVRSTASDELQRIDQMIGSKERELDSAFRKLSSIYKSKGYLADTVETLRNGRRVLTVQAEHKRKVKGLIHDESATGKTCYIEPEKTIIINNTIVSLYVERKKEVYNILKILSASLIPHQELLADIEQRVIYMDLVRAKGLLALKMNANKIEIVSKPYIQYHMAYNPLLLLKNNEIDKETIPFDLRLDGKSRILLLSGPNAGGKSVAMKTVGLLQLMTQSGLLITASPDSSLGVFKSFFSDIGDMQSMDDDLSTYSAKLKSMKSIVENADKTSLILMDEFGSGTDPRQGGAIAEAILGEINHKRAFGVITTHYSNIKYFASHTEGIVNGAMVFDKKELVATYQLKVGKPGSSYAFAIASNIGLDAKLIKKAKSLIGHKENKVDKLLIELQEEKKFLHDKLHSAVDQDDKLKRLITSHQELFDELKLQKKKLELEQTKEEVISDKVRRTELERLIQKLQKKADTQEAIEVSKKVKNRLKQNEEKLKDLHFEMNLELANDDEPIKANDKVLVRDGDQVGEVVNVNGDKALVSMGILTMEVYLSELTKVEEIKQQFRRSRGAKYNLAAHRQNVKIKLDIRAIHRKEAVFLVQEFIENALINDALEVQILHGKGTGSLRKMVAEIARQYPAIKSISHPEDNLGGDGITLLGF